MKVNSFDVVSSLEISFIYVMRLSNLLIDSGLRYNLALARLVLFLHIHIAFVVLL